MSETGSSAPQSVHGDGFVTTNPDPTKNVLDLVNAAVLRLNDLSATNERWSKQVRELESRRQAELASAESHRVNESLAYMDRMAELRANHSKELAAKESGRLDAIRQVDREAVTTAAVAADARAAVLAAAVNTSADTARNLVNATATAVAEQLAAINKTFTERLAAVEKAQYEGVGKSSIADPRSEAMIATVSALSKSISEGQGRSGITMPLTLAIAGLVGSALLFLFQSVTKPPAPVVLEAPVASSPAVVK